MFSTTLERYLILSKIMKICLAIYVIIKLIFDKPLLCEEIIGQALSTK